MEQRLPVLLVRQGDKFEPRYVELLTEQIQKWGQTDVITLTDQADTPGKTRRLAMSYEGWTAKMELFAPWNEDLRPCVFFDLDTMILFDITDITGMQPKDLWLIRDFYLHHRSNSGMMVIPKDTREIWSAFQGNTMVPFKDGDFLNEFPHKVLQDEYVGIVSYKANECQEAPKGRIVCWHGRPKPHECEGWVKDIWIKSKP